MCMGNCDHYELIALAEGVVASSIDDNVSLCECCEAKCKSKEFVSMCYDFEVPGYGTINSRQQTAS